MRFMIIRRADAQTEAGAEPSPELLDAMMRYHDEMMAAGILIEGTGLQPSRRGARVRFSDGRPSVIDGPFAETKELIAGYSIIEVASLDEAIAWVRMWPSLDGGGHVEIEIRPVIEPGDLGAAAEPQLRAFQERVRAARRHRGG
jgi:hypothetical protein